MLDSRIARRNTTYSELGMIMLKFATLEPQLHIGLKYSV